MTEKFNDITDVAEIFRPKGESRRSLEWIASALCAQTDPEKFFPEQGKSNKEAKQVCLQCDVRTECLEFALNNHYEFGVWGATTQEERNNIKRQRKNIS